MCTGFEIAVLALSAVSGTAAVSSGMAQSNMADYNAQVANQQRQQSIDVAKAQEDQKRRDLLRLMSSQQAALGKSGVTAEGSPLLMFEDTAINGELDAQTIRWQGKIGAAHADSSAALSQIQGSNAQTAGYFGAGSSLLNGVSRVYQPSNNTNTNTFTPNGGGTAPNAFTTNVDGAGFE